MNNKKAFTMFELVFVIVIAGILASLAIPRSNRDPLREAADQILMHIRYTQRLAMQDDKFDPANPNWFRSYWQIYFSKSKEYTDNSQTYNIFSDKNYDGNPNLNELAINPENNGKLMSAGFAGILNFRDSKASKNLNLTKKYWVDSVFLSGGCGGSGNPTRIYFDGLGRPITGSLKIKGSASRPTSNLMKTLCTITLRGKDGGSLSIIVQPETGFACVASQTNMRECDELATPK